MKITELTEGIARPYPTERKVANSFKSKYVKSLFKTDSGITYELTLSIKTIDGVIIGRVMFVAEGNNEFDLIMGTDAFRDKFGMQNDPRVLSTIISELKDMLVQEKVEVIGYSASDWRLSRFYDAVVGRMAKSLNFKTAFSEGLERVLAKDSVDVTDEIISKALRF